MTFANVVMTAFIAAQALDGVLTYAGIGTYGVQIEGNPVLTWYMMAVGPGAALIGAKVLAVACGYLLHRRALNNVLFALTVGYLLLTIPLWSQVLWLR